MAKKLPPKYDAFDLALSQMSVNQLKKLAAIYKKGTQYCETREDYVGRLRTVMSGDEKLEAMRLFVLAGKTSLTLYTLDYEPDVEKYEFTPTFKGVAAREPDIVTVGKVGEVHPGQQLVQWAIVTGLTNYLDIHLNLKVEARSVVVDSFYEPHSSLLQIRANSMIAKRIAMAWAKQANVNFSAAARIRGIETEQDADAFATQMGGSIRKCGGNKRESRGVLRMTATRHPNVQDLRGTEDYAQFSHDVDLVDWVIEFTHQKKLCAVGINITTGSFSFMSVTPESAIQHVYEQLKKFLKIK